MKKLIAFFHLLIILTLWSSFFWASWKIMLLFYGLYLLQNIIFDGCVLSIWEFGNNKESFFEHYLYKVGIKIPGKIIDNILDYGIYPGFIILSYILHPKS